MDQNAEQTLQEIKATARFHIELALRAARITANSQALHTRLSADVDQLELGRVYGIRGLLHFDAPEICVESEAALNEMYFLANYARRQQLRLLTGARR